MKHFSILALISLATLFSCKKDKTPSGHDDMVSPPESVLKLQPVFGSTNLKLDSVYTLSNGFEIKILELKAYFTDVQAGGITLKDAALFDFRLHGDLVFDVTGIAAGSSNSIQFGIGVPGMINHNDPSLFPSSNPLNIAIANDMHWDWNPGYIFFKVEAKVDTIVDGVTNCDHNLIYHVGTDGYYTSKTVNNIQWTQTNGVNTKLFTSKLKLDMKNFFENPGSPIDVKTEFTSHSMMPQQSAITEKARQNFAASISAL
jgi:hypothetical protein